MRLTDEEKRSRKIDRELEASSKVALRRGEVGDDAPLSDAEKIIRARAYRRKWKLRNPDKVREERRRHAQKHHDAIIEKQRQRRAKKRVEKIEAERAKVRAYKKAWRRANLERELARGREESKRFRANNPESVRASQRKWNAANMEYKRQHDRDRYAADPEKFKTKRRAKARQQGPAALPSGG